MSLSGISANHGSGPDQDEKGNLQQSPYASNTVEIFFNKQGPLRVHDEVLRKSPILLSRLTRHAYSTGSQLYVDDIPIDVGHVIVHFLFTGKYQSLQPNEQSETEKVRSQFSTALRVYATAESYRLPVLATLAKAQMKVLGSNLSLACMIGIVEGQPPSLLNVAGIARYLESRVQSSLKTLAGSEEILNELRVSDTDMTIPKIILRGVASLRSSELASESPPTKDLVDEIPAAEIPAEEAPPPKEVDVVLEDRPLDQTSTFPDHIEEYPQPQSPVFSNLQEEPPTSTDMPNIEYPSVATPGDCEQAAPIEIEEPVTEPPLLATPQYGEEESTAPIELFTIPSLPPSPPSIPKKSKKKKKRTKPEAAMANSEAVENAASAPVPIEANAGWFNSMDSPKPRTFVGLQTKFGSSENKPQENDDDLSIISAHECAPEGGCGLRSDHLTIHGGWKTCPSCNSLVQKHSMN